MTIDNVGQTAICLTYSNDAVKIFLNYFLELMICLVDNTLRFFFQVDP